MAEQVLQQDVKHHMSIKLPPAAVITVGGDGMGTSSLTMYWLAAAVQRMSHISRISLLAKPILGLNMLMLLQNKLVENKSIVSMLVS